MYTYIYMHGSMYIYMHRCMYVCVFFNIHIHMHVCVGISVAYNEVNPLPQIIPNWGL